MGSYESLTIMEGKIRKGLFLYFNFVKYQCGYLFRPYFLIKDNSFFRFYEFFHWQRIFSNFTTFILFGQFFMPYVYSKITRKLLENFLVTVVYSKLYVYPFCQIFQALRFFPVLRLFRILEYPQVFRVSSAPTVHCRVVLNKIKLVW